MPLGVPVSEGEAVPVGDGPCDGDPEGVDVALLVSHWDGDPLAEDVWLRVSLNVTLGVGEGLGVALGEAEALAVSDADCVGVCTDGDWLGDADRDGD